MVDWGFRNSKLKAHNSTKSIDHTHAQCAFLLLLRNAFGERERPGQIIPFKGNNFSIVRSSPGAQALPLNR